MGLSHSPSAVTDGLVLCLDAGNPKSYPGSGTAWTDLSGRENNGTLTNGPTYSSANGGIVTFDGTDDYVVCSTSDSLTFTNQVTLSMWLSANTATGFRCAFGRMSYDNWDDGFSFYRTSTTLNFYVNDYEGAQSVSVSKTAFTMSNWVCVYDGSNLKMYENGILRVSGSSYTSNIINPTVAGNNFKIGAGTKSTQSPGDQPPGYFWNGSIASVSLYNRGLSAAEVAQNFNAIRGRFGL